MLLLIYISQPARNGLTNKLSHFYDVSPTVGFQVSFPLLEAIICKEGNGAGSLNTFYVLHQWFKS